MNGNSPQFTLGYFTAALPQMPLEEQIAWAARQGFEALEVAAWPVPHWRTYRGGNLVVQGLNRRRVDALQKLLERNHIRISALGYYDNGLHPGVAARRRILNHLKRVILAAQCLGVSLVGIFLGRHPDRSEDENLHSIPAVYDPIMDLAESSNVRLMVENCPMLGWQRQGMVGNIAYRPGVWNVLFERYPRLGLNFDPSHLVWQGMNPVRLLRQYADRIYHVHAKDTQMDEGKLAEEGYLSVGWWQYRLPGYGMIDWNEFFQALKEIEYKGTVSIEHEDAHWSGSEDKVREGLALCCREMQRWREKTLRESIVTRRK